jgi:hypothetical protein
MSNFEERLLNALKDQATIMSDEKSLSRTPALRPRRRTLSLVGAAAGVAAAATAAVTVFGGAGTPAYAVTKGADGTVNTKINELRDANGLKAALAKKGINAVVDFLPAGQTCKEPRGKRGELTAKLGSSIDKDNKVAFSIEGGQIGPNLTLVLVVSGDPEPGSAKTANLQVIKGKVSPCESVPEPAAPAIPDKGSDANDRGPSLKSKQG